MPTADESPEFPRPPVAFTDRAERDLEIDAYDGDAEPLVAMYADFDADSRAQGLPPRHEDEIREWIEGLLVEGYNVVVWHGDRIVGHAVLVPYDGTSELAIFVHPGYQSVGIGSQLIRVLLGHGQQQGLDNVWLAVERTNHIAMRLYDSVGFETTTRDRAENEMERSL
ncbi:GNAT family N-acetyltransferase [Haloarcula sp. GH36]|uniref:GNAT family N-acetyltransferase n=1 Tax=Haloarcula montana TaxID=3111776 RepID=UPI002D793C7B|nr:GNAT family N-acetyltransferase [Haloarcula sp. GH36]